MVDRTPAGVVFVYWRELHSSLLAAWRQQGGPANLHVDNLQVTTYGDWDCSFLGASIRQT